MVAATTRGGIMAQPRRKPPTRKQDPVSQGWGETFEQAVENALTPKFRRRELKTDRAEVISTEIIVSNPNLQYHVVVRFPEN
jgi:hypothetical protein